MTPYIMAMMVGFAVLMFWPLSRDKFVRNCARSLAALVFSVGLLGFMSRILFSAA